MTERLIPQDSTPDRGWVGDQVDKALDDGVKAITPDVTRQVIRVVPVAYMEYFLFGGLRKKVEDALKSRFDIGIPNEGDERTVTWSSFEDLKQADGVLWLQAQLDRHKKFTSRTRKDAKAIIELHGTDWGLTIQEFYKLAKTG